MKSIDFQLAHEDVGLVGLGDSQNERDVIGARLNMQFNLQVTSLFATYGATDRLDVSIAFRWLRRRSTRPPREGCSVTPP